jgi:hypothetical protein
MASVIRPELKPTPTLKVCAMSKKVCSICKKPYTGFDNNADPVNDGRCCDRCNESVVVPARIRLLNLSLDVEHELFQRDDGGAA